MPVIRAPKVLVFPVNRQGTLDLFLGHKMVKTVSGGYDSNASLLVRQFPETPLPSALGNVESRFDRIAQRSHDKARH